MTALCMHRFIADTDPDAIKAFHRLFGVARYCMKSISKYDDEEAAFAACLTVNGHEEMFVHKVDIKMVRFCIFSRFVFVNWKFHPTFLERFMII